MQIGIPIKNSRCSECGAKETILDCGTFSYCSNCFAEVVIMRSVQ